MKICLGGTFDRLHKGHKKLLETAAEKAGGNGYIFVGVTKGEIVEHKQKIQSFEKRKNNVEKFLKKIDKKFSFDIKPIKDKYGPAIKGDFDAIVVSPETRKVAEEINEKRKSLDLKKLEIIEIPWVLAEDDKPIRSTRIRKNEINPDGELN
ncbi:MAG: pantetheine-phosphate adenylyltransferase [Candidatus Thermoplasmatota archaeon]